MEQSKKLFLDTHVFCRKLFAFKPIDSLDHRESELT